MPTITIPRRYNGPPASGNGGYSCGVVARQTEAPVRVTLHAPPPLDTPMEVTPGDGGGIAVHDGETLVASAVPDTEPVADPPMVVDLATATRAIDDYVGFELHPFPTCWVCGPDRAVGDGLRLFTGLVEGAPRSYAASPWIPHAELADDTGAVSLEQVWAALDCPSYFGGAPGKFAVLGSLTVDQRAPVEIGVPYVVAGWSTAEPDGRKLPAGSAILTADGEVVAAARALWIELRKEVAERMATSPRGSVDSPTE